MRTYHVIYLWRGERHGTLTDHHDLTSANEERNALRADGWRAWVEEA